MAICKQCRQDTMTVVSCTQVTVWVDGAGEMTRIPYSLESADAPERCRDCNVAVGGFHHKYCNLERCPKCGGQLVSCGCVPSWFRK